MVDAEFAMDQSFDVVVVAVRTPFSVGIVVESITREEREVREVHIAVVRDIAAVAATALDREAWAVAPGHEWVAGGIHAWGVVDAHG